MADEAQGFLGRWSRRKNEVLKGGSPAEPVRSAPAPAIPVISAIPAIPVGPSAAMSATPDANEVVTGPQEQVLSLEDVRLLTKDSDFKPFMAQGVDASVRNAAVKKLFTDPHFNVMDGLDIYIDDYSISDPIPESMLRQMTSVKFLGLFADEDDADKQALLATQEDADNPAAEAVKQSSENVAAGSAVAVPDHTPSLNPTSTPIQPAPLPAAMDVVASQEANANTDLRLQPDHATSAPSTGSGT